MFAFDMTSDESFGAFDAFAPSRALDPDAPMEPAPAQPDADAPMEPAAAQPDADAPMEPAPAQPDADAPMEPAAAQPDPDAQARPLAPPTAGSPTDAAQDLFSYMTDGVARSPGGSDAHEPAVDDGGDGAAFAHGSPFADMYGAADGDGTSETLKLPAGPYAEDSPAGLGGPSTIGVCREPLRWPANVLHVPRLGPGHNPMWLLNAPGSGLATFEQKFARVFKPIMKVFKPGFGSKLTATQRSLLLHFMQTKKVPKLGTLFSPKDGSSLTMRQKILITGAMHVLDRSPKKAHRLRNGRMSDVRAYRRHGKVNGHWRYRPFKKNGKYVCQRQQRGANCGDWVLRQYEYASGERHTKNWGANGKARHGTSHILPQSQAISQKEFACLEPGDWLMIKWKHTTKDNWNHSVLFIGFTDTTNPTRRPASVMDQADNDVGGGDFHFADKDPNTADKPWKKRNGTTIPVYLSCDVRKPPYIYAVIKPDGKKCHNK